MISTTTQIPPQSQAAFESNTDIILGIHRGAIDQTTITTQPPSKVIKRLNTILQNMGVRIQEESTFRYRCIRPKKVIGDDEDDSRSISTTTTADTDADTVTADADAVKDGGAEKDNNLNEQALIAPSKNGQECVLYGSPADDPADEVRFSVEVTQLAGLNGTYSVDIRRLKGNLKSYKFIYDAIRDRAELNR